MGCQPNGGCDFVADPKLAWRNVDLFWQPEVATDVVTFGHAPGNFVVGPTAVDLARRAVVSRSASDGLHLLWADRTQLWIAASFEDDQPLSALLPLGPGRERRAYAAINVGRALDGLAPLPLPRSSAQALARLGLCLRALDGTLQRASTREIAVGLFGRARVPSGAAWKGSDVRSRTMRLVRDGRALMSGGYLALLR